MMVIACCTIHAQLERNTFLVAKEQKRTVWVRVARQAIRILALVIAGIQMEKKSGVMRNSQDKTIQHVAHNVYPITNAKLTLSPLTVIALFLVPH
jgi:hypothetical protein